MVLPSHPVPPCGSDRAPGRRLVVVSETVDPGDERVVEADAAASVVRIRLGIAYDGTDFRGWSRQPGLRTVQGVLEDALGTLFRRTGEAPRLTVAGRTDAGVHALGQVAHLDVGEAALMSVVRPRRGRDEDASPEATLARRLTGIIGADADVVVTHAERAPAGFDARFSAIWRRYEYRVADASATRDPLERRRTHVVPRAPRSRRRQHHGQRPRPTR